MRAAMRAGGAPLLHGLLSWEPIEPAVDPGDGDGEAAEGEAAEPGRLVGPAVRGNPTPCLTTICCTCHVAICQSPNCCCSTCRRLCCSDVASLARSGSHRECGRMRDVASLVLARLCLIGFVDC